jgi:hypothetical protein
MHTFSIGMACALTEFVRELDGLKVPDSPIRLFPFLVGSLFSRPANIEGPLADSPGQPSQAKQGHGMDMAVGTCSGPTGTTHAFIRRLGLAHWVNR